MEFRKLYEIFETFLPLIVIGLWIAIKRFRAKRDPLYAAREALRHYNEDTKSHERRGREMLWCVAFVLILGFSVAYDRFEVGFLSYPYYNFFFGMCVLVLSASGTVWIGRKIYRETKSSVSRISYLTHSTGAVIFISLLFGSIQFLIYFGDKESYVIDPDILAVQIKQDTIDFNNQIQLHISVANEARKLKAVFSDSLGYTVFPFRGSKNGRGFVFTNRADGFEYLIKDYNIDVFIVAPWGPPFGPTTIEEVISVEVWSNDIHLQKYLARDNELVQCTKDARTFDTRNLMPFCDSVISEETAIASYMEQKKELAKAGNVTWDVFGVNAILSSFLSSPDYSKPVKKWGMIVSILHVIVAVCLIAPNIIPVFTFYKETKE